MRKLVKAYQNLEIVDQKIILGSPIMLLLAGMAIDCTELLRLNTFSGAATVAVAVAMLGILSGHLIYSVIQKAAKAIATIVQMK